MRGTGGGGMKFMIWATARLSLTHKMQMHFMGFHEGDRGRRNDISVWATAPKLLTAQISSYCVPQVIVILNAYGVVLYTYNQ